LHRESVGGADIAAASSGSREIPFWKMLDTSIYAGVRPAPVTGASHDISKDNFPDGIRDGSILLEPASDTGLRLGAGRVESNPKGRSSADFENPS